MHSLDLIATAKSSLSATKGKPSEACLRRAVSTAYYALFHCLARDCADLLIGGSQAARSDQAWRQAYRALEHGHAKEQCKNKSVMSKFPKEIEDFANIFITLQEKRHNADYDPVTKINKSAVYSDLALAEQAIMRYRTEKRADRRAFCAWVLLKRRALATL